VILLQQDVGNLHGESYSIAITVAHKADKKEPEKREVLEFFVEDSSTPQLMYYN
jgi:hypothetical protein